jgi:hypothetical protein
VIIIPPDVKAAPKGYRSNNNVVTLNATATPKAWIENQLFDDKRYGLYFVADTVSKSIEMKEKGIVEISQKSANYDDTTIRLGISVVCNVHAWEPIGIDTDLVVNIGETKTL